MSLVVPGSTFQVSQLDADALSIVGFAVSLSQSDVPYNIVPNAPVAPSSTDLLVYGDTVTITGDLVNPGRTIAIYARQIVVGATAFINVTGPDPRRRTRLMARRARMGAARPMASGPARSFWRRNRSSRVDRTPAPVRPPARSVWDSCSRRSRR
jgi:hypothetical protein